MEFTTDALTTEEARALAIFLLELRNVEQGSLTRTPLDDGDLSVDEDPKQPGDTAAAESNGAASDDSTANPKRRGRPKAARSIQEESPIFVLSHPKTSVQIQCNAGRKGEVEAAKGHLETWLRDSETVEEVASIAAACETFIATALTKKEQTVMARLISEVKQGLMPATLDAAIASARHETKDGEYTLDAVKVAGKALVTAKGLPAFETVLAKFKARGLRDLKPEDYAQVIVAISIAMD
jgi:hypothetical protein